MKGLKKVALASAIAAVSVGAQAELKALDDAAMGELTGQAGLTIDLETSFSIGEFQYRDQDAEAGSTPGGSVLIRGIRQGGNSAWTGYDTGQTGSDLLDNARITLDVAGANPLENTGFNYGFSEIGRLSLFVNAQGNPNTEFGFNGNVIQQRDANPLATDVPVDFSTGKVADLGTGQWAAGLGGSVAQATEFDLTDPTNPINLGTSENGSDAAGVEDGDLVIHVGFTDAFHAGGGFDEFNNSTGSTATQTDTASVDNISWADARDVATRAVDFSFGIDAIALASSGYTVGDVARDLEGDATNAQNNQTTVLISDLSLTGFLGPVDIHIENDGNDFGADGSGILGLANSGDADSKITWNTYFRVTNLDVYIDIAGISLEGVEIHNDRGDLTGLDGSSSFGFAQSRRVIYAVNDAVIDLNVGDDLQNPVDQAIADLYVDGLQLNTEFKGDIDIDALRFGGVGNGESIGQIYLTDVESVTNWTISAH